MNQRADNRQSVNGGRTAQVVVIGGGFTGLSAAYELTRRGISATILERESICGGLAGSFEVNGGQLERFYHHWFASDEQIFGLIKELGLEDLVVHRRIQTGIYFQNRTYRLSRPFDLLRFRPLSLTARIRLGLLTLSVRRVRDWKKLESFTAEEWLLKAVGPEVYRVLWEPLLRGKFGPLASKVSAVWIWNKLKLRGGSRSMQGAEVLSYFRGGFASLIAQITAAIESAGGVIKTGTSAISLALTDEGRVCGVHTSRGFIEADAVIATTALPITADLLKSCNEKEYIHLLGRINYLANICLVMELDRRLTDIYWLNISDPAFPFVAIVEHTNFEPPEIYGGHHIVYLSKYLHTTDSLFKMNDADMLGYCLPYLKRIFPGFNDDWILDHHVWRSRFAQPIVERHYIDLIPPMETPIRGLYLCTMAQIYPEDRGTNYAVREGRRAGRMVAEALNMFTLSPPPTA